MKNRFRLIFDPTYFSLGILYCVFLLCVGVAGALFGMVINIIFYFFGLTQDIITYILFWGCGLAFILFTIRWTKPIRKKIIGFIEQYPR